METKTQTTTPAKPQAELMNLGNSQLIFADVKQDIRGRKVLDPNRHEIGHVADLLIDDQEHKVRFLQVASGGFLGLGARTFLIPIDALNSVEPNHVSINLEREHIAGAPLYDPDLEDVNYYSNIYGYYGYDPFWGMGYNSPIGPYMPPLFPSGDEEEQAYRERERDGEQSHEI